MISNNEKLNNPIDELYCEIGETLHSGVGVLGFDKNDYIKLGKDWFNENKNKLKEKICTEKIYNVLKDESDKKKISLVIADTISSIILYVPVVTIAALITKIGIDEFCLNFTPTISE